MFCFPASLPLFHDFILCCCPIPLCKRAHPCTCTHRQEHTAAQAALLGNGDEQGACALQGGYVRGRHPRGGQVLTGDSKGNTLQQGTGRRPKCIRSLVQDRNVAACAPAFWPNAGHPHPQAVTHLAAPGGCGRIAVAIRLRALDSASLTVRGPSGHMMRSCSGRGRQEC